MEFKSRQYMQTTGRDFLALPGVAAFYRAMTAPNQMGRISQLSALTCDGNVVSANLDFVGRGRFYGALTAYDPTYRRFRVGYLLMQHLIDQASERGFDTFDLGIGDFSYKEKWATHRLTLYAYERAVTAAGQFYLQMRRARRLVRATAVRRWFDPAQWGRRNPEHAADAARARHDLERSPALR